MDYFAINFATAPAWESEDFAYVARTTCEVCGLNSLHIFNRYLVPEDTVEKLSLETEDETLPEIFEAAGMLIAKKTLAEELESEGISGFSIRPVNIISLTGNKSICDYAWLAIHGRCETNSVWSRVVSRCPKCGMERTEPVNSSIRRIVIQEPLPMEDIFRTRERNAGIIISSKLHDLLQAKYSEHLNFKAIQHE
jgi:hypothetical protein